jgi:negative regulator of sigma E activity
MHDMSDNRISEQPGPGQDKLDAHCRQQLSALIDGELSPDEARFLLRRLGHDRELSACFDRWQLAGDMLRRVPCRAAPAGLPTALPPRWGLNAPKPMAAARAPVARAAAWLRWSGGALAASVAAVALFVARQHLGGVEPEAPAPDAPR